MVELRMTSEQYRALGNAKKISKKNLELINKGKLPVRSEDDECLDLVRWLEGHPDILFFSHIRSESKGGGGQLGAYFKRMGLRKGLPDYFILSSELQLILVEVKTVDGGKIGPEQKRLFEILKKMEAKCLEKGNKFRSVHFKICNGHKEAKNFILDTIFSEKK